MPTPYEQLVHEMEHPPGVPTEVIDGCVKALFDRVAQSGYPGLPGEVFSLRAIIGEILALQVADPQDDLPVSPIPRLAVQDARQRVKDYLRVRKAKGYTWDGVHSIDARGGFLRVSDLEALVEPQPLRHYPPAPERG